MSYYLFENEDQFEYYNAALDSILMIVEKDNEYIVTLSPHDADWLKDNANEMDEQDFIDKANNISTFARLGTHPPHSPPH